MSEKTAISWCDSTVSFWIGCTKVSPGCVNCYAEKEDRRQLHERVIHWGKGAPRYKCKGAVKSLLAMNRKPWICNDCGRPAKSFAHPGMVSNDPLVWCDCSGVVGKHRGHRRKVFINQQADWLDPEVPIEWLAEMLDTIRLCPELDIMLLTKRPELFFERMTLAIGYDLRCEAHGKGFNDWASHWANGKSPANVMVGATVEDQKRADERIPELLKIPAKFRFLSVEPQLEDIVLPKLDGIHLLINGGESGTNARPFNLQWARNLRDQCKQTGVKFYFKQAGSNVRDYREPGRPDRGMVSMRPYIKDRSGANPDEWPEDLRIQEPFAIERL